MKSCTTPCSTRFAYNLRAFFGDPLSHIFIKTPPSTHTHAHVLAYVSPRILHQGAQLRCNSTATCPNAPALRGVRLPITRSSSTLPNRRRRRPKRPAERLPLPLPMQPPTNPAKRSMSLGTMPLRLVVRRSGQLSRCPIGWENSRQHQCRRVPQVCILAKLYLPHHGARICRHMPLDVVFLAS